MSKLTLAASQMHCTWDLGSNISRAEGLVREAAGAGAQLVLIQELFQAPYFCKDENPDHFDLAKPAVGHPLLARMSELAAELEVVLPVSFYERAGNAFFNSLCMIDADGRQLGVYRKSHIPDGPGYEEKYYFSPGDTGFRVWTTRYGVMGVGICWDQWFPESARCMALMGAEVLLYPTAIGSEPVDSGIDTRDHWQRVMQGHAGANLMPLVASNRVGTECGERCEISFYGSSFISDATGAKVAEAGRDEQAVVIASFDLEEVRRWRQEWGIFRDRRPELYGSLLRYDATAST